VLKINVITILFILATGILATPNLAFAQVTLDAQNDEYFVDEDSTLTVDPIGVLQNDTIPEGETFMALLKTDVGFGVLTLNSDGSFEYTPFENFVSTDSFTYVTTNGVDESNVAIVTINVNPVNDAPVTVDDEYSTPEDTELTIIGSGVLDNDTDAENDSLSAILDLPPSDGALVLGLDGSFQYTPNVDFIGSDSFSYHSNDGLDDGNTATVTINVIAVNDLPQAVNDEYSTDESTSLNVSAPGVLANDSDPENDTLDALLDSTTTDGVLVLNSNGSFEYTPNNDFVGTDSFSYHAFDGADNSNIATVTIEVNPRDSDSIIDSILEQIQMIFDKIFVIEDEVAELKEQNSSLESRVAELEAMISSNPSHDHDNDNKDERKILKNEIKALKKEFKEAKKKLQQEYKEKEHELKNMIKDFKNDKKHDKDDSHGDDDD